ncbi:TetR/AcrR family transcriptional regulator [Nocardia jejuensis]|uniref:TetR/AcrR family transcriptional regulator n=1 Tax=Nocardia jejuensis TaxID=328049 RepID=UPI000834738F|nr:TetR/AcrR family transcriptional regulator [Nocardia jejuensis]
MSGPSEQPAHDDVDPRKARSRARLVDAATALLKTGGVEAITIEAVTRVSKVARTTLYRHFDNAAHLRAAALEHLLPPVVRAPEAGSLRDRLVELVSRQAALINGAPVHVTTLAWLATADHTDYGTAPAFTSLRHRIIEQHRKPFDDLLGSPEARAALTDGTCELALAQLIGPIVFLRLIGSAPATPADCARIVDDFLAVRTRD